MELKLVFIFLIALHYGSCPNCDCVDINMLKYIVQNEMTERINLASKVAILEKRESHLMKNLDEELLTLKAERQKSARMNAALLTAWGHQKQAMLKEVDTIRSAVQDTKDTKQILIDYQAKTNFSLKSLQEITDSILKDNTLQSERITRLEVQYTSFQATTEDTRETIHQMKQNFKELVDKIVTTNSTKKPVHSIIDTLCPKLRSLQNGRIFQNSSDGLANNYQSVAEYTCNYGYIINGTNSQNARRQCQADGTWDGYDYFCDILRCKPIKEFYGGSVRYFGREERAAGSYAVYDCADTYCLQPKISRSECRKSDLSWLPVPPKCFKKLETQCPINSECTGQKSLCQYDSIKIKCKHGFELYSQTDDSFLDLKEMTVSNDNGTAVINQRIRVSPEALPLCVEEKCDPENHQHVNGSKVFEKKRSGTAFRVDCEIGYEFSPRTFGRVGIVSEAVICRSGIFYYREKKFQGCEESRDSLQGTNRLRASDDGEHGKNIPVRVYGNVSVWDVL